MFRKIYMYSNTIITKMYNFKHFTLVHNLLKCATVDIVAHDHCLVISDSVLVDQHF